MLVPFEYTSLLWATIIGYLVWRDIPSTEVWIGAVIIIACGLYVIHRESLHHRSLRSERGSGSLEMRVNGTFFLPVRSLAAVG